MPFNSFFLVPRCRLHNNKALAGVSVFIYFKMTAMQEIQVNVSILCKKKPCRNIFILYAMKCLQKCFVWNSFPRVYLHIWLKCFICNISTCIYLCELKRTTSLAAEVAPNQRLFSIMLITKGWKGHDIDPCHYKYICVYYKQGSFTTDWDSIVALSYYDDDFDSWLLLLKFSWLLWQVLNVLYYHLIKTTNTSFLKRR